VFGDELESLRESFLLREIRDRSSPQGRTIIVAGRECLNFSSNDYLGLANHPALKDAARSALGEYGTGAGASRLLSGGTDIHRALEERIAGLKGAEAALVFNSGYAANTGAIPALAGEGDAILSDELNHASIVDGCRLSRAKTLVYRHRDAGHLDEILGAVPARRKIVVTDTVFSMDGDIAPLKDIAGLCGRHGALLYLDDAHGTGVLGGGRGALEHAGVRPEPWIVQMGTFSKALGSFGAFVAAEKSVVRFLLNTARSLMFSTALPAPVAAASLMAVEMVASEEAPVERLWTNREMLCSALKGIGLDFGNSETPIVPVMARDAGAALALSEELLRRGIYAPAIRPPAVETPRLRISVTAAHTGGDIDALIEGLRSAI